VPADAVCHAVLRLPSGLMPKTTRAAFHPPFSSELQKLAQFRILGPQLNTGSINK